MAENRPYRIQRSATDARLTRVKRIAILSLASAFIAINWVTTQHAANLLRDAPWLGQPLFRLPGTGPLYLPWAWIVWWTRWHVAPALAPLWTLCVREALYPTAVIAAVAAGAIAFARNGSLANASDLHGSARWANTRDLAEARLIDSRGTRLRSIAASLRLVRPRAHRACVYLGVWRRSLIRDRGHTHVLVVGPTQSGKGRGIVIPTLLTWPHSVVVNDVKDENWALTLGRLDMFAKSLSLIAGYGIKACLIAQDLTQIRGAYGHDETITSNCDTRVAFRPNGIETARLLSQMTGETTVRHSHRTTSSSGASVSEPEVGRPLLTADEAMRLGSNEELIFASGRPTIRARKLRHYRARAFRRLAKIPPRLVSDRIERDTEPEAETVAPVEPPIQGVAPTIPERPAPTDAATATKRPAQGEQLSFLRFAIENKNGSDDTASGRDAKERLL